MPKAPENEVARLRVKIGSHEFEAEGSHQVVATHFEAWKQLLAQHAPAGSPVAVPAYAAGALPAGDIRDLFNTDVRRNMVTLRVPVSAQVPDAEVALLIIYGYGQCFGGDGREVPVTRLKEALAASGHRCDRIDRTLAGYVAAALLKKKGQRKGTAYALTPAGYQRAENRARALRAPLPPA
jgi:hypothetical protein